jgi:hypothetical protein
MAQMHVERLNHMKITNLHSTYRIWCRYDFFMQNFPDFCRIIRIIPEEKYNLMMANYCLDLGLHYKTHQLTRYPFLFPIATLTSGLKGKREQKRPIKGTRRPTAFPKRVTLKLRDCGG